MVEGVKYWLTIIICSVLGGMFVPFIIANVFASALGGEGKVAIIIGLLLTLVFPLVAKYLANRISNNEAEGHKAFFLVFILQIAAGFLEFYLIIKVFSPQAT